MVYKLEVFKQNRKSEQVLIERIIQSENSNWDLTKKFQDEYRGFGVRLYGVENVEVVNIEKPVVTPSIDLGKKEDKPKKTIDMLLIEAKYTKDEWCLILDCRKLTSSIFELKQKIKNSVYKRYEIATNAYGSIGGVDFVGTSEKINVKIYLNGKLEEIVKDEDEVI